MNKESPTFILISIGATLVPDAAIAECRAIGSSDQVNRRSYVREVFALVGGLNYARRLLAEESPHLPVQARQNAQDAARTVEETAKENGLRGLPVKTRASFAAFAAAYNNDNPLTGTEQAWDTFIQAVAIRNRITHPKSHADCSVSDDEFKVVQQAHRWYLEIDRRLLDRSG